MGKPNRWVRRAQFVAGGLALVFLGIRLLPPHVYTKDLQQEYLTAWALRDGLDLFTPMTTLSARYFPVQTTNFPHASPHPPVLALISLPLTLVPFPVLVPIALGLNLILLVVVGRRLGLSAHGSFALAAWPPLWWVLDISQLELLILFLALLAWRAADTGHDGRAGLWLGLAAALKFYPGLLVLPYLARRRWRVPLAAGLVFALSQLGSLVAVGPAGFLRYYLEVLPAVAGTYVRLGLNSSPYGALLRLFGGATDVAPLIEAPGVVLPLATAISLFGLVALLVLKPPASPVALLVALPSAWGYYAVLALPQIVALLRGRRYRAVVLAAAVATSIILPLVNLAIEPALAWSVDTATVRAGALILAGLQPLGYIALLTSIALTALAMKSVRSDRERSSGADYRSSPSLSPRGGQPATHLRRNTGSRQ